MKDNIFIGEAYKVDPNTIKFDNDISTFNTKHNDREYEATKRSIEAIGQTNPILINSQTNLCEDGKHRVAICIELGIFVLCIKINGNLSVQERLLLANQNTTSGRDFTIQQKAIHAFKYSKKTGVKLYSSAKIFKVDKLQVGFIATIYACGRHDILEDLLLDKSISLGDKFTKNLRTISSYVKKELEAKNLIELTDQLVTDYSKLIDTEAGKILYWNAIESNKGNKLSSDIHSILVEYCNLRYRLRVTDE
jgi:hypothetical protein